MAELKEKLPKYCVIKRRKGYSVVYFQVPKNRRPEGWSPTYTIGRTDQLSQSEIITRGKEFYKKLKDARKDKDLKIERGPPRGSLAHIIQIYKESEYWLNLKPATRASYDPHLNIIREWSEKSRFAHVRDYQAQHISKFLEQWRDSPRTRKYYKVVLSILFNIAQTEGFVKGNIVKDIRLPKMKKEKRKLVIWEQSDIDKWIKQADSMGYPNAGTAVLLSFETGQRQTDVFNFQQPRDYNAGKFSFETSKTRTQINIRAPQKLIKRLAKVRKTQLLLTVNDKTGHKWTKNSFHHVFKEISEACGMEEFVYRQIRNSTAIQADRAGMSDAEFESIYGWPKPRDMLRQFYSDRDQTVANRGIKRLEKHRKAEKGASGKVGRNG